MGGNLVGSRAAAVLARNEETKSGPPLLVCRRSYKLRILTASLLGVLVVVIGIQLPNPWNLVSVGAAILILLGVWLFDQRFRAHLFRDRIDVQSIVGRATVELNSATKYGQSASTFLINGIATGTALKLVVDDGKSRVVFRRLDQMREMMELLTELERTDVLPVALQQRERGAPVRFGPLRIQGDMLHVQNKQVTLAAVTTVQADNGALKFRVSGKRLAWASIPIFAIPNFATLLELLRREPDLQFQGFGG